MKQSFTLGLLAAFLLTLATAGTMKSYAQFTTGNVVVLQVGNGVNTLSSTAAPLFLKEYNTSTANQASPVSSVAIPPSGTGGARLTNSGSATSEGQITLSADSTKIVLAGYDADTGTLSIASSSSLTVPRAIDTVSKLGIPGRADTTQTAFSTNNIRSATRGNGEHYWAAGGNTGTYYMGNLAAPTVIQSATATNTRTILAANGKLYFTSSSGTPRLLRINSQPTSATAADTLILLGSGASPYGFAINSSESVVYIADDRTTTAGGIQKWTLSGSTWTLAYTLSAGSGIGARSVIADWSTSYPTLYAVTTVAGGSLVKFVDSNLNAVPLTLATGTATGIIRSVAFAPRAVVTCVPAVLSATPGAFTCTANGAITLSATGGSAPYTFSWTGPNSFTASTQNLSNLQPGTYNVTVTATGGCSSTTSAIVINNATLSATANATGSTTRCAKDSVLLTAASGTGYKYQWKLNGNALNTGDTLQSYKAGASGSYTVTISSGINCSATSAAIAVTVNPLPSTTISAGSSTTFCTGGSVQLCAPLGIGFSYQFRQNGANITGATSQCYTATTSGTYKVFVTSPLGCLDSTATGVVVTVGAPPAATLNPSGTVNICTGNFVRLRTNSATGLSYSWKRNGVTLSGIGTTDSVLTVSTPGIYSASVSAGPGCTSSSQNDTVIVNPLPSTNVTLLTPSVICGGDTIRVRATGGTGNLYTWSAQGSGTTIAQTDSNYVVVAGTSTTAIATYSFRVFVTSAAGCRDSSLWQNITINPLPAPALSYNGGYLTTGFYASYQWFRNGVLIPNASGSLYTPLQNGTYTVRVTNANGCSATSSSVVVQGVGIDKLSAAGIRIFPNPARELLLIEAPFAIRARISDMQGREVIATSEAKAVSLASLADGAYMITIYSSDNTIIGSQLILKNAR